MDRVGPRRVLIVGTLITGSCLISLFFVPSYQAMFVILLLSGLGAGCIFPAAVKAIILWFSSAERATVLGFNQTAINVGGIIGATLLPTIAITLGWRYGFLLLGSSALAVCLSCAALYRNPPQETAAITTTGLHPATDHRSTTRLTIELFKSRDIWTLSAAGFFLSIVEFTAMAHLVIYLTEYLVFGTIAAGALLAMTEATGAFGKPTSGFVSDRLLKGRRKPVFLIMACTAVIICLVISVAGRDIGWFLYPTLIVLGMAAIGWGGLYATLAGELGGRDLAGVSSGTATAVVVLGVVIGPPMFGHVVDITGSFQIAWAILALSGAVSVIFGCMIREHKKRI